MELKIRPLKEEDYDEILVGWWKDWGWDVPPRDFLPQNATGGVMASDGDTPVCAAFLYSTNSATAAIEWVISNKDYRKGEKRKEAIRLVLKTLGRIAKGLEYKYITAILHHESLIQSYEDEGFVVANKNIQEVIKVLG